MIHVFYKKKYIIDKISKDDIFYYKYIKIYKKYIHFTKNKV